MNDDDDDDVGGDDGNDNDDDSSAMMLDDSSNMMLDAPDQSLSNSSSIDMPVNDLRPKVATEADVWVQVARRRNRGKRN